MRKPRHILIFGAGGRLGTALAREYASAGEKVTALRREDGDLHSPALVAEAVLSHRPDIVINCAAMTNVDTCESEEEAARTINAVAPGAMADAATATGARLLHISTDYVFSGDAQAPYAEDDPPEPISCYGATKREGEQAVLAAGERHAVVRVSWVFGPDRDCFIDHALRKALHGETVAAVDDKWSSPTYTLDVAAVLPALMEDEAPGGVYHVCNRGVCTWRDWAQEAINAAAELGLEIKTPKVGALQLADIKAMIGRRPVFTPMTCARIEALSGQPLRPWQEAVADYVRLLRDEGRLAIA
jgi:dTDP-4-dehydrorhamnose reductase